MLHKSHPEVLNRLRRAYGHLASVITMVESRRPCTATAQQLHAVVRALENAKRRYIQDHIDHCIASDSPDSKDSSDSPERIDDLKAIVKFL